LENTAKNLYAAYLLVVDEYMTYRVVAASRERQKKSAECNADR
jgi:hypothetical protein